MEARNFLQTSALRLATLVGLVVLLALGSQRAASRVDAPIQAAPIQARAEVVGSGEAGRAAGLIDLLVQQIAEDPVAGLTAGTRLDTEGIVRITLLDVTSPAPAGEFCHATVLVEYLAN